MKKEDESESCFAKRIRMVLNRLFEDSSKVLASKTDVFVSNTACNPFFDSMDCETDDSPFHFFPEPIDDAFFDVTQIDSVPHKHTPTFSVCVCHVSETFQFPIDASDAVRRSLTPPRNDLVQLLQRRLPISLVMLHPRRLPPLAPVRLEDCLGSASVIRKDENCRFCKQESSYLMENCITKLPSILVILLKRFSFHAIGAGNVSTKITTPVLFPLEGLRLRSLALDDTHSVYDLWAVCNHTGRRTSDTTTPTAVSERMAHASGSNTMTSACGRSLRKTSNRPMPTFSSIGGVRRCRSRSKRYPRRIVR